MCAECVIATAVIASSSVSLATLALGLLKSKKKRIVQKTHPITKEDK